MTKHKLQDVLPTSEKTKLTARGFISISQFIRKHDLPQSTVYSWVLGNLTKRKPPLFEIRHAYVAEGPGKTLMVDEADLLEKAMPGYLERREKANKLNKVRAKGPGRIAVRREPDVITAYVSIHSAAKQLGCHAGVVRRAIKLQNVRYQRLGNTVLVHLQDMRELQDLKEKEQRKLDEQRGKIEPVDKRADIRWTDVELSIEEHVRRALLGFETRLISLLTKDIRVSVDAPAVDYTRIERMIRSLAIDYDRLGQLFGQVIQQQLSAEMLKLWQEISSTKTELARMKASLAPILPPEN